MDALDLRVKRALKPVGAAKLEQISTLAGAIAECMALSGLKDKVIAIETDTDPGLLTRIKSGDAGAKGEFLDRLMDVCGNELPLLWLAHNRGYDVASMRRKTTELEQQLAAEKARAEAAERELETIKKFVRETGNR